MCDFLNERPVNFYLIPEGTSDFVVDTYSNVIVDVVLADVRDLAQVLRAVCLLIDKIAGVVKTLIGFLCFFIFLVVLYYLLELTSY